MKTIIAIGGGEMGRPILDADKNIIGHYDRETTPIDREIIAMTGKKSPRVLFVPTASGDSLGYCDVFQNHYGDLLGCKVSNLLLLKEPEAGEISDLILNADIIYVGGGNTQFMQQVWEKNGVPALIKQAYENGTILCGVSAGANCWFEKSSTDSFMTKEDKENLQIAMEKLAIIDDLGFLKGICCPHYLKEAHRRPAFLHQIKKYEGIAYGIDNEAALLFQDEKLVRVLKSKPTAKAFEITSKDGQVVEKEIDL